MLKRYDVQVEKEEKRHGRDGPAVLVASKIFLIDRLGVHKPEEFNDYGFALMCADGLNMRENR